MLEEGVPSKSKKKAETIDYALVYIVKDMTLLLRYVVSRISEKIRIGITTKSVLIIVKWTFGNKRQWNFDQITKFFIHENASENAACEMGAILCRGANLNPIW